MRERESVLQDDEIKAKAASLLSFYGILTIKSGWAGAEGAFTAAS